MTMNIAAWLRAWGLERYAQAFDDNHVDDVPTLCSLTEADLVEIGVSSVGHRRKLMTAIARLAASPTSLLPEAAATAPPHAECRQLTVLYCEMTGPAVHSASGHEEALREAIQSFQRTCTKIVADYDGHIANFYGDCMLSYFGWPRAHEDDAERAVRAALSLVQRHHELSAGCGSLSARAGIATGPVVVGDLIHEGPACEQSAVGVTPNLGARMLGLARSGEVVVDELTRRLLASSFLVQPLGRHALKGFDEPMAAHAVTGERQTDSRFDAYRGRELAPMIGRDQELALLIERWELAQRGEGQAVLLVGEAGIGKSRIVRAVLDACAAPSHRRIRWQCSPYHMGSALWPVIQRLGRSVGLNADDTTDAALDKLETLTGDDGEASALYATLLGVNGNQRYGPLEMTPQTLRERTMELLVEHLYEMAEERPLLLVVEDAHWLDPTTLELIERCLEKIDSARMLILITSRPDKQPELGAHPCVSRLSLNRLNRASVEKMVARLGGEGLRSDMLATIVAQTDGVPLFVEELTKAVLETGGAAIPASLHGSLMARLDRVPEVKQVAQIAACIGREFDQALLQAVAERPETVAAAVDKLVAAELVFRRGTHTLPKFTFKHALVQEAAYESLLRGRRRALHGRILNVLEATRPDTPAEILAHHAERGQLTSKAIDLWGKAGHAASAQSAYAEAVGYLTRAIELIQGLGDDADRQSQELELQLLLGHACFAAVGHGSATTKTAFERANELLDAGRADPSLELRVQHGLFSWHCTRGHATECRRAANRVMGAARAVGTDTALILAHRLAGMSHLYVGEWMAARDHFGRSLALSEQQADGPVQHGVNAAATAAACLGWTLHIMGCPQQAQAALVRSRDTGSLLHLPANAAAITLLHRAVPGVCARDWASARADTEALANLAAKHRLPMYGAYAQALRGWLLIGCGGDARKAVALFESGLTNLEATGTRNCQTMFMAGLAIAQAACGRPADGLRTIERVDTEELGQAWYEPELHRIRGELIEGARPGDRDEAMQSFERALSIARGSGARLWELRAATSLARLLCRHGERTEALSLLQPVLDAFGEGYDTRDLVDARAALRGVAVVQRTIGLGG
ncbi:MAG TPA: AAA family ATPase [Burkholderiaceae bacterium]